MNFVYELKRRNVFRVGIAYLVAAWLLLQLISILLPAFDAPPWVMRVAILFLGIGFFVALFIAWAFEMTPEGIKPTTEVNQEKSITKQTGQKLNTMIIGILVLVVAVMALDNYVFTGTGDTSNETLAEATVQSEATSGEGSVSNASDTSSETPEKSVAVLPFRDLSPEGDQGWFADGVSEEISNMLTRVNGLSVINTGSSFVFRDQEDDLQAVREGLNVNYLLSGSVRRGGDNLRIGVQLKDTRTDQQLWSDNYQGTLSDIFMVQEDIARQVAQALEISLSVGALGSLADMTTNPRAYDLYLQGSQLAENLFDTESLRSQINLLEQALEIDPEFTSAAMALITLYNRSRSFSTVYLPERESRVAELRQKIRTLEPDHPSVKVLDFQDAIASGRWQEAEDFINSVNYDEIRTLNIQDGQFSFTVFLLMTGRLDESIAVATQALALDPLNAPLHWLLAEALARRGDLDSALQVNAEAIAISPVELITGSRLLMLLAKGDLEGLNTLISNRTGGSDINDIGLANLDTPAQGIAEYKALLAEGQNIPPGLMTVIGAWLTWLGDPQSALELHRSMVAEEVINKAATALDIFRPIYADMRQLPGFKDLVREVGLYDYWSSTGNWGDYCQPIAGTDNDFECF